MKRSEAWELTKADEPMMYFPLNQAILEVSVTFCEIALCKNFG